MIDKLVRIKISVFSLAFFVSMISCTQNDLPQRTETFDGGIVFTSPYSITRSEALRYGSFKEGDKVGVLGYCEAENLGVDISSSPWDTKKPFCTPDVFYNQKLTYQGEGLWSYIWDGTGNVGGIHPWIKDNEDYTYSFFAYYPYVEISSYTNKGDIPNNGGTITLSGENEKDNPTITYTMPHDGNSASGSKLEWKNIPDFMLAYRVDHVKSDGVVRLPFRHLFCAFEFRVNNYNETSVTIGGLRVSGENFYKSVTVTGQESGYHVGDDRYSGYFDVISASEAGFECPAGNIIKDNDGNIIEVIPTTVSITTDGSATAEGDPIDLLFIPDGNGKLTENLNESLYLNIEINELDIQKSMNLKDASFEPGVRSVFNINIVGNDIYLQVESTGSWDDGGDSDIVFE